MERNVPLWNVGMRSESYKLLILIDKNPGTDMAMRMCSANGGSWGIKPVCLRQITNWFGYYFLIKGGRKSGV